MIGIGGAGMAPLALLARKEGYTVSGSDCTANAKTAGLASHGIRVTIGHDAANLPPDTSMVVYSSAIPEDNPEREAAKHLGIKQLSRGMFLAMLSAAYSTVVAVSGAHGKSSTTALIAHILTVAGKSPTFLIGADLNGVGSFSPGKNWNIFVTEVDESDGTHVFVFPALGVVPNIEEDHAWSVGGAAALMDNFASFSRHCRHLIYCAGENPDRIFADHPSAERLTDIAEEYLGFYGFQAANAQLAVAAAVYLGVPREQAETAARSFPGIGRRMQLRHRSERLIVIEDYAHHPSEIAAALRLLRRQYPGHHLRVLIQPHRYARLEYFFDGFRRELAQADSVLIAPVFAAWTESGSVGSSDLAAALPNARSLDCGWKETAGIAVVPCPGDPRPLLLAVLGAGDISEVFQYLPG